VTDTNTDGDRERHRFYGTCSVSGSPRAKRGVFNGSRISCAAQRRQRYAQRKPSYAARRLAATTGALLGRVSCMRLLAGVRSPVVHG